MSVLFITGAGRGIGAETARLAIARGHHVAQTVRAVELHPCPRTPSPACGSGTDLPDEPEVLQLGHEAGHRRVRQAGASRYVRS